jgi:hypothetical protein
MYLRSLRLTGLLGGLFISILTPLAALAVAAPKPVSTEGYAITFAQLSSAVDQQPGGFVQFELNDGVKGVTVTKNSVTVVRPGSYLIIAAPQVTVTKDGGCIDAWLVVNGKDVKNSGVRQCQGKAGNTDVVVSQAIMKLKKGDRIQVKTSGNGVKLDAIQPKEEPLIPSIIFTVLGL